MTKVANNQNVRIQLQGIELLKSQINTPEINDFKTDKFHFNIKVSAKVNPERRFIVIITNVNVLGDQLTEVLGYVEISCIFFIENFEEVIEISGIEANIPQKIIDSLNSISISTLRGVMFEQFRGTILHHAYLPIINPKTLNYALPMTDRKDDITAN